MKTILLPMLVATTVCACSGVAPSHLHSSYAGEETREIKALSSQEIRGLLDGAGMGYAKSAELNHYPGPMHTLDLAEPMKLTSAQREAIQGLLDAHKVEARELGARIIALEAALDRLFSSRAVTRELLDARLRELAKEQSALRASHLRAHLATTAWLSEEQIRKYESLRGYKRP